MQERKASIEKARLLICQKQMLGFRTVAARLIHRIRSLEAHNLKVRAPVDTFTAGWLEGAVMYAIFLSIPPLKEPLNCCFHSLANQGVAAASAEA